MRAMSRKGVSNRFAIEPGLHIGRKNRKHGLENMFLSCAAMASSLYGSNDSKY